MFVAAYIQTVGSVFVWERYMNGDEPFTAGDVFGVFSAIFFGVNVLGIAMAGFKCVIEARINCFKVY